MKTVDSVYDKKMERIVEVIQRIQGESKFMKKEKMGDFSLKNVI